MPNEPAIPENEATAPKATGTRRIPVLPVRDTVLFPHAVLPLTVGRESSIQLIESLGEERAIVVTAQLDPRLDSPKPADLHTVGTLATVHKIVRMPNQSRFVFTEGVSRVRLVGFVQSVRPYRGWTRAAERSRLGAQSSRRRSWRAQGLRLERSGRTGLRLPR